MILLEERTNYLRLQTGLIVNGYFDETKNKTYFEFSEDGKTVLASTYTYKKAKVLAKGIQIGRLLSHRAT